MKSLARLNDVESISHIGSWEWHIPSDTVVWSDQEYRLHGLTPGAIKPSYQAFLDLLHPEDKEKTKNIIQSLFKKGEYASWKVRVPLPSGNTKTLLNHLRLVRDSHGLPIEMFGITQDVTERIEFENSLIASRDFLKSLIETTSVGVCAMDRDFNVTFWNPGIEKISGLTRDQVLGKSVLEMFPFIMKWGEYESLQRAMHGEKSSSEEKPFEITQVQRKGFYKVSRSPLRDKEQNIIGVLSTVEDVTRLHNIKKIEQAIIETGDQLSTSLDKTKILQIFSDIVVPKFADWCLMLSIGTPKTPLIRVVHVNPEIGSKMSRLIENLSIENFRTCVGKTLSPSFIPEVSETDWMEACADENIGKALCESKCRSLISIPLMSAASVDPIGKILIGSCEKNFSEDDYSLMRAICSRLSNAIENADLFEKTNAAVKAREDMMEIVSHDLQNPLGTIQIATDLINRICAKIDLPEVLPAKEYMEVIQRSLKQAQELVATILDASLIQSEGLVTRTALLPIGDVVENAFKIFFPLARSKSISLKLSSAIESDLKIPIDGARITQALSNLLSNALKFTPPQGAIEIELTSTRKFVHVAVKDTGKGIPTDVLHKIYERNWQADRKQGGVGLGLFITKGIVESHGGRLSAESSPGKGTRISFDLPLKSRKKNHKEVDLQH